MNSKLPLLNKQPLQLYKSALSRQLLGKKGEDYAVSYLQSKGYSIVDRNFKATHGELDIIALQPENVIGRTNVRGRGNLSKKNLQYSLVFIEVKARIGRDFGLPEESVTP